tara:strand:+ start:29885 stop:31582 length:1698 start_codon:yes stop_codon:yes gene_type:complete
MPVIPSVFRPIRSNDFQRRAFKSYKTYRITSTAFTTSSGYVHHNGIYRKLPINIGHAAETFPVNSLDGTNQHVIWHSLDHRYYGDPYNPVKSNELTNATVTEKHLYESASCLVAPYLEVGERIKPGTVTGTFTNGHSYTLQDDGYGNLRDTIISTASFASSSRNIFHMSFNKEFGNKGPVQKQYKTSNFKEEDGIGINMTGGVTQTSGNSFKTNNKTFIRVPHEETFNKFNYYDDWSISFWIYNSVVKNRPIISKGGVRKQLYIDKRNSLTKYRDKTVNMPSITSSYSNIRTPFVIGVARPAGNGLSGSVHFHASDGTRELHISSSAANYISSNLEWQHVCIRNSASLCQMFVNGNSAGTTSGSLPIGVTSNNDDIIIGNFISGSQSITNDNYIAEIRMYDYAVSNTEINSLSNRHYLSGSLFQTNVAGNVFYRNGEMVISSPMSKYNTGSGGFGNTFNVSYKGTHTIYENEVLVRVPKDQFNVSMNPTATFTPATNKILSQTEEGHALPGDTRKTMFTSKQVNPYITTIGLYNDKAQLLAVSKLAQPVQKRDDIDMNFIVRWDY